jgi:hypothetical protein
VDLTGDINKGSQIHLDSPGQSMSWKELVFLMICTLSVYVRKYTHWPVYWVHPSSTRSDPPLPPEEPDFFGAWKHCSIGIKGPNVYQENIPHIIPPQPPACTINTRQDEVMDSCCVHQNPNSAISMTQQEPGFVGAGNIFPLFNCPVLVITCTLEPLLLVFS